MAFSNKTIFFATVSPHLVRMAVILSVSLYLTAVDFICIADENCHYILNRCSLGPE